MSRSKKTALAVAYWWVERKPLKFSSLEQRARAQLCSVHLLKGPNTRQASSCWLCRIARDQSLFASCSKQRKPQASTVSHNDRGMLIPSASARLFLQEGAMDMRKGFEGLTLWLNNALSHQLPQAPTLFSSTIYATAWRFCIRMGMVWPFGTSAWRKEPFPAEQAERRLAATSCFFLKGGVP